MPEIFTLHHETNCPRTWQPTPGTACTCPFPYPVVYNPRYAVEFDGRRILALQVPGGFWAVKVRQHAGRWVVFAVPRRGTTGEPFGIAVGDDRAFAVEVAIEWADCATAAVIRLDRIVQASTGNSTEEIPVSVDLDTLAAQCTRHHPPARRHPTPPGRL